MVTKSMKMMSDSAYSSHIGERIGSYFQDAHESITIISPFITVDLFRSLIKLAHVQKLVVVTSWRPDHLIQGYSDLSLYEVCKSYGYELRINNQIHAKMYLFDESILSIGSANCTKAGFGINKKSNLEVMIDKVPSNQELNIVSEIISKSIRVDDSLYDQVNQWLINQPKQDFKPIQGYLLLEDGMSVESLPGSDTPMSMWKSSTNEPDDKSDKLASIDWTRFGLCSEDSYEDFLESMKLKFDNIPVVQNFLQFIDESDNGRRFGECKSWVRDHYCGTNYDYCLEITQMLYSWIPELYNQYRVWRPHYTQIIYNINRHKI